jgi:dihydrofolate synthase/folylpolyglutamate synthase
VLALLHALGDPHLDRVTVHVAGSKGKGSVSAMVDAILRAPGIQTGLFTSPHLQDYRERIRINGDLISEEEVASLVSDVLRPAVDSVQEELGERTFVTFDLLTALGFLAFRSQQLEAQVIEVGLGGRVDSTNVFDAKEVAVITPLSREHTHILGDRIEAIAREKAAIITAGCVAVMAPQAFPEAARVVRDAADAAGARLVDVAADYTWEVLGHDRRSQAVRITGPRATSEVRLSLLGAHQAENAATAIAAIDALRDRLNISDAAVSEGLQGVSWPGRLEVLQDEPLIVADGAHNRESARRLREALRDYLSADRALFIVGASADKDIDGFAEELAPIASEVMAVTSQHPRAMDRERIAAAFTARGIEVELWTSIADAIDAAIATTHRSGVICLAGSLFVAAEASEHMHTRRMAGGR